MWRTWGCRSTTCCGAPGRASSCGSSRDVVDAFARTTWKDMLAGNPLARARAEPALGPGQTPRLPPGAGVDDGLRVAVEAERRVDRLGRGLREVGAGDDRHADLGGGDHVDI